MNEHVIYKEDGEEISQEEYQEAFPPLNDRITKLVNPQNNKDILENGR